MNGLLRTEQAVIVEGKYDKIKLESIIDATIIVTNGYGIFKDKEKLELIRFYAKHKGIIILTDPDGAGFKIRGYLKGSVPEGKITNVYIPDVFGKEKRKEKPSCEGKLGVEGIKKELIIEAFRKAGISFTDDGNTERRRKILKKTGLPERLSTTGMLEAFNTMMTREEFYKLTENKGETD